MYLTFAEKGIRFASGSLTLQTAPLLPASAPHGESGQEKTEREGAPAVALSAARSAA
jgi:hypothetical protein